jgi:hypothetical protein
MSGDETNQHNKHGEQWANSFLPEHVIPPSPLQTRACFEISRRMTKMADKPHTVDSADEAPDINKTFRHQRVNFSSKK